MKWKLALLLYACTLAASCATKLTKEGEQVHIVTESQKEMLCERIKLVSTRAGTGPDKPGSALGKALNEAAAAGANGFFILSQNIDWAIGATVTGEALKCNL